MATEEVASTSGRREAFQRLPFAWSLKAQLAPDSSLVVLDSIKGALIHCHITRADFTAASTHGAEVLINGGQVLVSNQGRPAQLCSAHELIIGVKEAETPNSGEGLQLKGMCLAAAAYLIIRLAHFQPIE